MLGEGNEAHLLGKVASRCKTSEGGDFTIHIHIVNLCTLQNCLNRYFFFKDTYRLPKKRAIYPEGKKNQQPIFIFYPISVSFLENFYEYITSISIELLVL